MIKVNLIREGRRPVAARAGRAEFAGERDWGQILLLALLLAGLLVTAGRWWLLHSEVRANEAELATLQKEVDALAPIIKEVQAFEVKKAELQHKIDVISGLKANQKGPVRIMDEVSRAVPEMLWLTKMEVSAGQVTINGEAFNSNAVASFIENLDRVPEFQEPVLVDMRRGKQSYQYTVTFRYSSAGEET